ncbi:AzlC family ABC transporter permease [Brevibacillus ruminantium]|uniref:AzlC family ABC transporter permease n=1 Tax=Brevibacillus ruminantium TaxID=2950604 RepID=A0ABY4WE42_9BACL|nr:AzlC family ABC transporter permease [Brevibacillus ruminantium]USG63574.1 AzlC family ABC transporter permease [Brevibacillus ruminantium]
MSEKACRPAWQQGIVDSVPIGVSFLVFGGIFGMLGLQAGLSTAENVLMSFFVHAGSAQFAVLPMLAEGAGFWAMVLVTLLLNSRYFLMGLSLAPYYSKQSRRFANLIAFFMSDEQYAITYNRIRLYGFDSAYILSVSLFLHLFWALGTWLGSIAGHLLPDPHRFGLEYSFTAMFLALSVGMLSSKVRVAVFLGCGAAACLLSAWSVNGLHVLAAGVLAFAAGYWRMPAGSNQMVEGEKPAG